MADDVGYVEDGPKGKHCADCKSFESSTTNPEVGTCAGYDVKASASCNYFEMKEET